MNFWLILFSGLILTTNAVAAVGGQFAQAGEFPQTVALTFTKNPESLGEVYCSGTLIGPRAVLTTAHCFMMGAKAFKVSPQEFEKQSGIFLGEENSSANLPFVPVHYKIFAVHIFPQNPTIHTDLALAVLSEDVDLGSWQITPAPFTFPTEKMLALPLFSVGYGMLTENTRKGFKSFFSLPLRSFNGLVGLGVGKPYEPSPSACHGDSGGSGYIRSAQGELQFVGVEYAISNAPCGNAATYFIPLTPKIQDWIKSFQVELFE